MTKISIQTFNSLMARVTKPGQYLGNEVNAVHKDFDKKELRVCLVFPDAYEIGMSNTGLRILYTILNEIDGVVAERCFAPAKDLEKALRKSATPLFSLESRTPLSEFDIIGISLPFELTYTNILAILDLAQIPLRRENRGPQHPIILGGGTQAYNPEPVADFFDAIALGDGEEIVLDIARIVRDWKRENSIDRISSHTNPLAKTALLDSFTSITGLYVPQFFVPEYNESGTISRIQALKPGYEKISKRIVANLDQAAYPTDFVVPNIKLVHDRIGIEIQRGCTRMCRFCQAGYIERPTRQRSPEKILDIAEKSLKATGIDEISLLSLSAGDYATIVPTLKELNARYKKERVSISVPATRTETLTPEMIAEVASVRKTGFTIAPEAGSERMRRVINKGNKVEDLMKACDNAFSAGYRLIKFYYMCGLPFENDDDVIGIAHEAGLALACGMKHTRQAEINVSVSSLVPKPFTPFQWAPQMTIEETERKHRLIKKNLSSRRLHFKNHNPRMSYLEGLFARGDRRLSVVIEEAFKRGCRFDQWEEHLDYAMWESVFKDLAIDLDFYLHRERGRDEVLPWDHLYAQMRKEWLWDEFENARKEAFTDDCSIARCADFCGACDFKTVKNKIYVIDEKDIAAKKGNREWYGRFGKQSEKKQESEATPTDESISSLPKRSQSDRKKTATLKLRCDFIKIESAALFGHLDLMGFLKRALLRCRVPVAYTEGFHPQIKLSMGAALPVGVESECESFDVYLTDSIEINGFLSEMNRALPAGIRLMSANYVDLHSPAPYSMVSGVDYQVDLPETLSESTLDEIRRNTNELREGKDFYVERFAKEQGKPAKTLHVNRLLHDTKLMANERIWRFSTLVDDKATLKPSEVILALSKIDPSELPRLRVRKTGIRTAHSGSGT